jgi:hypothetical protein
MNMSKKFQTTLENLQLAIHGVTAPFSCEGTCVAGKPVTFIFRDWNQFEVIRATTARIRGRSATKSLPLSRGYR